MGLENSSVWSCWQSGIRIAFRCAPRVRERGCGAAVPRERGAATLGRRVGMTRMRASSKWAAAVFSLALLFLAGAVQAAELKVMSSGGLTAAFQAPIPAYEKATGNKVDLVLGPSM